MILDPSQLATGVLEGAKTARKNQQTDPAAHNATGEASSEAFGRFLVPVENETPQPHPDPSQLEPWSSATLSKSELQEALAALPFTPPDAEVGPHLEKAAVVMAVDRPPVAGTSSESPPTIKAGSTPGLGEPQRSSHEIAGAMAGSAFNTKPSKLPVVPATQVPSASASVPGGPGAPQSGTATDTSDIPQVLQGMALPPGKPAIPTPIVRLTPSSVAQANVKNGPSGEGISLPGLKQPVPLENPSPVPPAETKSGPAPNPHAMPVKLVRSQQAVNLTMAQPLKDAAKAFQFVTVAPAKAEPTIISSQPAVLVAAPADGGQSTLIKPTEMADLVRSLVADMKRSAQTALLTSAPATPSTPQLKTLQVNLYPRDLGAVEITIRLAGDNATIAIKAQTQAALTRIQNDLESIHKSIQLSGQTVEEIQLGRLAATHPQTDGLKGDPFLGDKGGFEGADLPESAANHPQDESEQAAENRDFLEFQVKNETGRIEPDSRDGLYM